MYARTSNLYYVYVYNLFFEGDSRWLFRSGYDEVKASFLVQITQIFELTPRQDYFGRCAAYEKYFETVLVCMHEVEPKVLLTVIKARIVMKKKAL